MQIKRFEAGDMTEALRMVKREFGDEAVILSAKEVRPGGFFSALRKKSVEITAATDYPAEDASGNDFSGVLSRHLDDEAQTDRVSLSSVPRMFTPFAPEASPSVQEAPAATEPPPARSDRSETAPESGMPANGLAPRPAAATCFSDEGEASTAPWVRSLALSNLVAAPFYRNGTQPTTIAMVGPSGAGKSTMAAKLAWRCRTVEKKRIGLLSLDRFRFGANAMLERVARIMKLPFTVIYDAGQLQSTLDDLAGVDVVLIDTPGISGMDASMMDDMGALIRSVGPDETHLVASATVRDEVFLAAVDAFSQLGVNRLLPTRMDEVIDDRSMLTLLEKARLPVSFYADGPDLFDGLKETATGRIAAAPRIKPSHVSVAPFGSRKYEATSRPAAGAGNREAGPYVANRNSELFHHPDCKSVKRINAQNITAFNSIEEAMDEGFRPCRACCNISMVSKPVMPAFGNTRASAI
ncbi:hypothetical protein DSCA_07050 [Desulfosarcina alkanivorans]|uniref:Flagellar biosynthesis protein FlhF n=1 Tax=Desulfosarcina alkanivorans TaxID=571177 RepID=A0A5K7YEA6_9BACT|nr:Ada metal-binding domain-containing protein [Desulfosarcina alkanivorans]BBO66775.1 hypothetical protein DSCA_07050 [Desulfosarcina alkanivorans]